MYHFSLRIVSEQTGTYNLLQQFYCGAQQYSTAVLLLL